MSQKSQAEAWKIINPTTCPTVFAIAARKTTFALSKDRAYNEMGGNDRGITPRSKALGQLSPYFYQGLIGKPYDINSGDQAKFIAQYTFRVVVEVVRLIRAGKSPYMAKETSTGSGGSSGSGGTGTGKNKPGTTIDPSLYTGLVNELATLAENEATAKDQSAVDLNTAAISQINQQTAATQAAAKSDAASTMLPWILGALALFLIFKR